MCATRPKSNAARRRRFRLRQLTGQWPVSIDAEEHIAAIRALFDSGVSIVNIHSGQADQQKVIEFYAAEVLPRLQPADLRRRNILHLPSENTSHGRNRLNS